MRYLMVLLTLVFLLINCQPTITENKMSAEDREKMVSKMFYFRDKYDICYAAIQSYSYYGGIVSITAIPCTNVDTSTITNGKIREGR